MLTLAPIRPPDRVVDHFAPAHRYGGATRPTAAIRQRERATRQAEAAQHPRSLDRQRRHDRHRAAEAGIDLEALVRRARQRGKAPPAAWPQRIPTAPDDASAAAQPTRAAGC